MCSKKEAAGEDALKLQFALQSLQLPDPFHIWNAVPGEVEVCLKWVAERSSAVVRSEREATVNRLEGIARNMR